MSFTEEELTAALEQMVKKGELSKTWKIGTEGVEPAYYMTDEQAENYRKSKESALGGEKKP